jgi:hexosaminidase
MAATLPFSLLLLPTLATRSYLYYPSTDVSFVNETIFPQSNATTVASLSSACDATPGCLGFNLNGWLKSGTTSLGPGLVDSYFLAPTPAPPEPTYLWPQPASVSLGAGRVLVSSGLQFTEVGGGGTPELVAAFARFEAILFSRGSYDAVGAGGSRASGLPTVTSVLVSVANASVPLDVGVSESYTLSVPADGSPIALSSATVWGALHGLQTLTQLVGFDSEALAYWSPAPVAITDAPKFSYRGVMVDPARQFLPPALLRAVVDSLTQVKLNVLHVHLLDCDSFPAQVPPPYANLWQGSFSPRERYTAQELLGLSEYARVRGVTVIFEFDQPGHMGAMCKGYPSLCPTPACSAAYGGDVLDPSSPDTLPAMRAVVAALAAASPSSSILHLGGDEVNPACWLASPAVAAWMAAHNASSGDDVYRYFVAQSNAMALAVGKAPMRWEEVWRHFGTALHPSTIVHAWLTSAAMFQAASAGYRTVFSVNSAAYYLDYLDVPWSAVYSVDLLQGLSNASSLPYILGGQLCAWGETMDAASLMPVLWPRAAAAAERLWSYNFASANASSWDTVTRFAQLRCSLLERGVPATLPGVANAGDMRPAWTVGSCGGGFRKLC